MTGTDPRSEKGTDHYGVELRAGASSQLMSANVGF